MSECVRVRRHLHHIRLLLQLHPTYSQRQCLRLQLLEKEKEKERMKLHLHQIRLLLHPDVKGILFAEVHPRCRQRRCQQRQTPPFPRRQQGHQV